MKKVLISIFIGLIVVGAVIAAVIIALIFLVAIPFLALGLYFIATKAHPIFEKAIKTINIVHNLMNSLCEYNNLENYENIISLIINAIVK